MLALAEIGRLRVADPAIDLAAASALIDPAALPTFYEEYRNSRPRADEHVISRAELLAEFAVLDWLLEAVDSGDETAVDDAAALLTSFDEVLFGSASDGPASAHGPATDSASGAVDEADGAATRSSASATAAAGADAPDVEAAITETETSDVFIPRAQPTVTSSEDDSEFDSEPGSQVRTEPTRDSDDPDVGDPDVGDDTGSSR